MIGESLDSWKMFAQEPCLQNDENLTSIRFFGSTIVLTTACQLSNHLNNSETNRLAGMMAIFLKIKYIVWPNRMTSISWLHPTMSAPRPDVTVGVSVGHYFYTGSGRFLKLAISRKFSDET